MNIRSSLAVCCCWPVSLKAFLCDMASDTGLAMPTLIRSSAHYEPDFELPGGIYDPDKLPRQLRTFLDRTIRIDCDASVLEGDDQEYEVAAVVYHPRGPFPEPVVQVEQDDVYLIVISPEKCSRNAGASSHPYGPKSVVPQTSPTPASISLGMRLLLNNLQRLW